METETKSIKITQGLIKGLKQTTIYGDQYYRFEGIPYAKPPLGELRFKAPLPADGWEEERDCCAEFTTKPMQRNSAKEFEGSEDCLYMNVFSKNVNPTEKLPVMVWIYGGGFNHGFCSKFRPDYLMAKDMVLVTFNYRLSSLGFLSLNDPECNVPGNAALKDQILALKWVKQNIAQFGGDINNVTVFGESAGAAAVHFLLCSPAAEGLFHKAILQSGAILNNWAFAENATALSYHLAHDNGYNGPRNEKAILRFLQKLPAEKLLNTEKYDTEISAKGGFYAFLPSIEPYDTDDNVVRIPLLDQLKNAWGNDIPIMIGGTSFEGLVRYQRIKMLPDKNVEPMDLLPKEILDTQPKDELTEMAKELYKAHFKEVCQGDENEKEIIMSLMDYYTFRSFWHGVHRSIKSRLLNSIAPTYQYVFDFDSPTFNHHRVKFCGKDIEKGAAHGDDVDYLFFGESAWKLDKDSKEYLTIQRMTEMWHAFAKTSNPNCEYTQGDGWKSLNDSDIWKWFKISDDCTFEDVPEDFRNKLETWNKLYGKQLL